MYIMAASNRQLINSDFVERFCIVEKDDAVLIVASYSREGKPVTMARYLDVKEAEGAMGDLMAALAGGQISYTMPDSRLYHEEQIKKDARTKRRGGS